MTKYKLLAEKRAGILWGHYNKAGKLLLKDVQRLVNTQYDQLYKSFECHEIAAPPVYDSQKEKLRRKADVLREIKTERLTKTEASEALKIKKSRVSGVFVQIRKAGFEIPEIAEDNEYDGIFKAHGSVISTSHYYPHYLQAIECWRGPGENEITYRLY